MIGFHYNRSIPTTLKLNGPTLQWIQNPQDAVETFVGFATFVGIVSATYPEGQGDIVEGTYEFKWYIDDAELIDPGEDVEEEDVVDDRSVYIESGGNISTCTFTSLPYTDNGKSITVVADYIPAAGEGNANNDNLRSDPAIITTAPEILINTQPVGLTVGSTIEANFSIDAEILPEFGNILLYQWEIDGQKLVDGSQVLQNTSAPETTKLTVTSDAGDNFIIDFEDLATFSDFVSGRVYTLVAGGQLTARLTALGAGGGWGAKNNKGKRYVSGSVGGIAEGLFTFVKDQEYKMQVGTPGGRSGGGGLTGLFIDEITFDNSILIGGGGGGSSGRPGKGGAGGGLTGGGGSSSRAKSNAGGAGTQTAGGSGGSRSNGKKAGADGSQLQGGSGGASGGDGYYGGGGGSSRSRKKSGPGGGGSGYLHPTLITEGEFAVGVQENVSGEFRIDRTGISNLPVVEVSGANEPNLTINTSDTQFGGVLKCVLTSDGTVQNSPLESNAVSYAVVDTRNIINFESYTFDNQYKTSIVNFDSISNYTIDSSTFGSDYSIIQFHSTEKSVPVTLEMYSSKGTDNGSYVGGEGGVSTIEFTIDRNVEHTLIGIANNSALFLYRGSNLIAVVGEGGDAGTSGDGGAGGGINIPGEDGGGRLGGFGGEKINSGTLSLSGSYGSVYETSGISLYPGDSVAQSPNGGRTISCTKGSYWIDQGIAACSDNSSSEIKFVNVDGTTIDSSSNLIRGFKPGYTISNTSGLEINNGGRGGNGATGGGGGTSGAGGGGGSGYTDGSVTVTTSVLGSSVGNSKVVFMPFGRIVTFTQSKNSTENIYAVMTLISGSGPSQIAFGSQTGTDGSAPLNDIVVAISQGSIYRINTSSTTNVDSVFSGSDPNNQTVNFSDQDSNPVTLEVIVDRGKFSTFTKTGLTYTF